MTTIHGPSFGAPDDDSIALERLALEEASAFGVDLGQPPTGGLPARAAQPNAGDTHMPLAADVPDETPSLFASAATPAAPELGSAASYRTAASPNNPRKHVLAWDSDDERRALSLAASPPPRKPRWAPDGDDVVVGTESARRLRQQYLRLHSLPEWASSPRKRDLAEFRSSDESSDGEDTPVLAQPLADFLRDAAPLQQQQQQQQQQRLPSPASISPAEVVNIQPSPGLPDEHKGDITSVSFHPRLPMLLSTGADCQLCVRHVDAAARPSPHPLLSSVHTRCFVRHAEFSGSGGQRVFFAGGRRFLHEWDLATGLVKQADRMQGQPLEEHSWDRFKLSPCGRYLGLMACARKGVGGVVNVVMVAGMQWIAAARMESPGGALDFCWWKNSHGLSILGKGGEIGEYSIASRRFLGIWHDEGNSSGSAIAMGGSNGPEIVGGDQYVAIGSSSGRMNIYNRGELLAPYEINQSLIKRHPQPACSFGPLAGPVSFIAMAEASLAFGSRFQQDCLNLVHLPTMTGYPDWPTPAVPLGRVTAVGFGDGGKLLAAGNDSGKIWLWRLAG